MFRVLMSITLFLLYITFVKYLEFADVLADSRPFYAIGVTFDTLFELNGFSLDRPEDGSELDLQPPSDLNVTTRNGCKTSNQTRHIICPYAYYCTEIVVHENESNGARCESEALVFRGCSDSLLQRSVQVGSQSFFMKTCPHHLCNSSTLALSSVYVIGLIAVSHFLHWLSRKSFI